MNFKNPNTMLSHKEALPEIRDKMAVARAH